MSEKNNSSGSSFFLGLILGILITLLFTTKKGRKILKTLADEGVGSLEDFLEPNSDDLSDEEMPSGIDDEAGENEEKKASNVRKRVFRGLRKN